MAKILSIHTDKEACDVVLAKALQSGHTSFLLGSGASMPAISIAGDIESELDKLLEEDEGKYEERKFEFLSEIQEVTNRLVAHSENAVESETLESYAVFMGILGRILEERKTSLLPKQMTIFTTNYDVFPERAAEQVISARLNDGFDRVPSLSNTFKFEPGHFFDVTEKTGNLYKYKYPVPSLNLIKLHGSLTWSQDKNQLFFRSGAFSIPDKGDADFAKTSKDFLDAFSLILPTKKKFNQTLMERVYYDLLRIFANTMEIENSALISFGFSFEDEHILDITQRALKNPTLILIVLAFSEGSAAGYQEKFEQYNNVIVLHPDGEKNLDFPAFNSLLTEVIPKENHES